METTSSTSDASSPDAPIEPSAAAPTRRPGADASSPGRPGPAVAG